MLQWEFLVLLLDVLLVVVYFILAKSVDFAGEGKIQLNASAEPESFWIFVIFCLYLAWDVLTKIVLYWKERREEPWLRNYGVRMLPTLLCLVLAWAAMREFRNLDAPHVLTADFALLGIVLLFRALKDLISAFFSTRQVPANQLRAQRKWAIVWTLLCGVGLIVGILWTTRSWPLPGCIAVKIQTVASGQRRHTEISNRVFTFRKI